MRTTFRTRKVLVWASNRWQKQSTFLDMITGLCRTYRVLHQGLSTESRSSFAVEGSSIGDQKQIRFAKTLYQKMKHVFLKFSWTENFSGTHSISIPSSETAATSANKEQSRNPFHCNCIDLVSQYPAAVTVITNSVSVCRGLREGSQTLLDRPPENQSLALRIWCLHEVDS